MVVIYELRKLYFLAKLHPQINSMLELDTGYIIN